VVILMGLAIEDPRRLGTAASHLAGCTPIVHCFRFNVFLLLSSLTTVMMYEWGIDKFKSWIFIFQAMLDI
jgi:hypothetical protein